MSLSMFRASLGGGFKFVGLFLSTTSPPPPPPRPPPHYFLLFLVHTGITCCMAHRSPICAHEPKPVFCYRALQCIEATENDNHACMQVRPMATEPPSVIAASHASRHGSHVQEILGHALHKPDYSDVQISNSRSASDSIKQIRDLLADIDAAASLASRNSMVQRNATMRMANSAASTALDSTNRSGAKTTRGRNAMACNPHTTTRASSSTGVVCSKIPERTDLILKLTTRNQREVADQHSDIRTRNTAGAGLLPSAMDMDDHFCRWRCIARQNQSTGSSAYPPLPCWAAQIAPYPACEINSKRYQTRFWVKY